MKEVKDITTMNEAMVQVARMYAKKFGYIEVEDRIVDVIKEEKFWGNLVVASWYAQEHDYKKRFTYHKVKFIQPMIDEYVPEDKRVGRIEIDLHFGRPRLSVYFPSYIKTGEMVNLTYDTDKLVLEESQVWGYKGYEVAIPLKKAVDEAIEELNWS